MPTICTDTFTVMIALSLQCTLSISGERLKGPYSFGTTAIVVNFSYTIGTDHDVGSANFGFVLREPATLPVGIEFSDGMFAPVDPDVSGPPRELKNASVTTMLKVIKPDGTLNQDPPPYVGDAVNYDFTVELNTGT